MGLKITASDRELLAAVAEYRMLTVSQLALLLERNNRALRRRLATLVEAGAVRTIPHVPAGRRGRLEKLVTLDEKGLNALRKAVLVATEIQADQVLVTGAVWASSRSPDQPS